MAQEKRSMDLGKIQKCMLALANENQETNLVGIAISAEGIPTVHTNAEGLAEVAPPNLWNWLSLEEKYPNTDWLNAWQWIASYTRKGVKFTAGFTQKSASTLIDKIRKEMKDGRK